MQKNIRIATLGVNKTHWMTMSFSGFNAMFKKNGSNSSCKIDKIRENPFFGRLLLTTGTNSERPTTIGAWKVNVFVLSVIYILPLLL